MEKNGDNSGFNPDPPRFVQPTRPISHQIPVGVPIRPEHTFHGASYLQAPPPPVPGSEFNATAYVGSGSGSGRANWCGDELDLSLLSCGNVLKRGLYEEDDTNNIVEMRKKQKVDVHNAWPLFQTFPSGSNINMLVPLTLPANDMGQAKLTFLLEKELQKSDVSRLGRIVIPKKAAESHLPRFESGNSLPIIMEDMEGTSWEFNYRFWINNKSRMYVLENTGKFVQHHGLQIGDTILIHQESRTNKYVIETRKRAFPECAHAHPPLAQFF